MAADAWPAARGASRSVVAFGDSQEPDSLRRHPHAETPGHGASGLHFLRHGEVQGIQGPQGTCPLREQEALRPAVSGGGEADADWSALSLASAMRGMGDEASEYTEADLKEVFT